MSRVLPEPTVGIVDEKFRVLAENTHAAIGIVRGQRFIYANRYFAEMTGYSVDELMQLDFPALVHPTFRPMMIERARQRQHGEPVPSNYEFMMVTKSGEARWVDFSPAYIEYEGGPAIIGTGFDITERKLAQARLVASEARLRLLSDTATRFLVSEDPQSILGEVFDSVADHIGAEVFLNYMVTPGGERLRLHSWRGIDEAQVFPIRYLDFGQPYCAEVAREHHSLVLSHVRERPGIRDGEDILQVMGIRAYASHPLMDEGVVGTISFCARDRDEFSEAELGVMRAVADQASMALSRQNLTRALAQRAVSLDQANKSKDHFLAVLSHELRTPLTPVLPALAMVQDDVNIDEQTRDNLELIRRNVELEARLIDDLLDMTRIARGKIELNRHPVELARILAGAVEVCRPDIEARHLHFGVDMDDAALAMVFADASRLQQVFWNLLKNAIKFTPEDGCVAVRCRRDGPDHVVAEVIDSGVGIERDALDRIFNAFEQGEPAIRRQFGGLGLGLAISKTIIDLHGGTISAHSDGRNRGATFRVRIPSFVRADGGGKAMGGDAAGKRALAERKLSILLVEDHGDTARVMQRLLGSHGHRVCIAADVATALKMVCSSESATFDLLISDLGLPDGNGADLMRELRRRGSKVPGIALSGYGQEADIRRSREAGFSEHLIKPVAPDRLSEAIAVVAGGR